MSFTPDLLKGSAALVTGGGTGICRGIALALAAHGCDVAITSRRREHLEPTAAEIAAVGVRSLALAADVRDASAVAGVVRRGHLRPARHRQWRGRQLRERGDLLSHDRVVGCLARRAFARFDRAVVVKACSADIPHKSDHSLVVLDVRNAEDAAAAFTHLTARLDEMQAHYDGIIVAPMVSARRELALGARIDPIFGPVVMVGDGGRYVQALPDLALLLARSRCRRSCSSTTRSGCCSRTPVSTRRRSTRSPLRWDSRRSRNSHRKRC